MDTPQISRSGRVLKKSTKVKEMEDFDINKLDMQGRPRKKRASDKLDDKRAAPIKIPKISFNLSSEKRNPQNMPKLLQGSSMKHKPDQRKIFQDSSPECSKESDSSSVLSKSSTTTSSSSSSDESENDDEDSPEWYSNAGRKGIIMQNIKYVPSQQEKVIVETYRQESEMSMEGSDDETSGSTLVIAEESSDSMISPGGKKSAAYKARPPKVRKAITLRKKPPHRNVPAAKKAKPPAGKFKPKSAYMLWCQENRAKVASSTVGFGNISRKMGEMWQALPEKEKLNWRKKAKKLALKNSGGVINTGPASGTSAKITNRSTSTANDEILHSLTESKEILGTSAIDAAAHLKLLGESLSNIGQQLTEHEGQLAVSGIFSVLLDAILCAVGPLLCLISESSVLCSLPQDVLSKTLDSIAYFMPGL